MPIYLFQHPETEEIREIVQKVKDEHVYEDSGVKWKRIFTVPTAGIDTKIDPFSAREFTRKTENKRGKLGDLWDRSHELSDKREKLAGKDPVKEKHYEEYSKKRKGKEHPDIHKARREQEFKIKIA